jgi:hypothetical protein
MAVVVGDRRGRMGRDGTTSDTRDATAQGAGMSEVFVSAIMMDRRWSDFCITARYSSRARL